MFKHIVMYKLKESNETNANALREKFLSMKGKIDVLLDIQSGIDILKSARSYDVVLVCTFKNKDDLAKYSNHEVHIPVMNYVKSVISEAHSVDFEY